jgi:hypothetical protein
MRLRAEQDARKKQDKLDARRRRKEAAAAERRAPHAKAGGVGPGAH